MAVGVGKIRALTMTIGWRILPSLVGVAIEEEYTIFNGVFVFIQKNKDS